MALEFEIKLNDGVSAAAGSAAHQVDVLAKQMRGLQTAMIKANALGNEKAFAKAATDYQKLGKEVERLGGVMPKATTAQKSMGDASKLAATEMNAQLEIAKKVVGVIKDVATAIVDMTSAVYGFAQARQQITATFTALGAGKVGGEQVVAMFDKLSDVLPHSREQMSEWAKTMMNAGITDIPRLQQAIKAASASSAIFGDESGKTGDKIVGMMVHIQDAIRMRQGIGDITQELRGTGITSDELASKLHISRKQLEMMAASGQNLGKIGAAIQDSLIRKGAEPMKSMAASWGKITERFHAGVARIFEGIVNTPGFKMFRDLMLNIVMLFGSQSAAAKGMQTSATAAFDSIFKIASEFIEAGVLGLFDLYIGWLKFRLAIKPATDAIEKVSKKFSEFLGYKDEASAMNTVVDGLGKSLTGLAVSLGVIAALTAATLLPLVAIPAAVMYAIGAVTTLAGEFAEKFANMLDRGFKVGSDFVTGIMNGIKGNDQEVGKSLLSLSQKMQDGIKNPLKIRSPSQVGMSIGGFYAEGVAMGVEAKTPRVENATRDMSTVAVTGSASGAGASAKGGVTVTLASGAIQITGGAGADLMKLTEEAVVSLFERVALTQGVA